jgi:hypothetical protein
VRRLVRKLVLVGAWALGLLVIAYSAVYAKLNDYTLGAFISGKVNKVERGNFQLKYVHYPYWGGLLSILFNTPVHAEGRDFELHDPDGNLVLKVPGVEAEAHLQELVISLAKFALTFKFHLNLHISHAHATEAMAVVAPLSSQCAAAKQEMNILASMSPKLVGPPRTAS